MSVTADWAVQLADPEEQQGYPQLLPLHGATKAKSNALQLLSHGSTSMIALSDCRHMTHVTDEHQVLVSKVATRIPLGHVGCSEGPLVTDTV